MIEAFRKLADDRSVGPFVFRSVEHSQDASTTREGSACLANSCRECQRWSHGGRTSHHYLLKRSCGCQSPPLPSHQQSRCSDWSQMPASPSGIYSYASLYLYDGPLPLPERRSPAPPLAQAFAGRESGCWTP